MKPLSSVFIFQHHAPPARHSHRPDL